jgi:hypothetical protein
MEVVTDANILRAIEEEDLKKQYNIQDGSIVSDPKIINEINKQSEKKQNLKPDNSFFSKYISGDARTEFKDFKEIGEINILNQNGQTDIGKNTSIAVALSLTPSQDAQMDMIKKVVPGTISSKDKFNNVLLTFPKTNGGQTVYLNKPGISFQDVTQTTSQVLQYIPGAGFVTKKIGGGIFKKSLAQGTMAAGTSAAQDVVATGMGSEQGIEKDKAAISFAGGMVGEPVGRFLSRFTIEPIKKATGYVTKQIIDPLLPGSMSVSQLNIFSGKGLYLNSKGIITDKTKKLAKKHEIDLGNTNSQILKEFAQALEDGVDPSLAKELVGANQFGISLWKAQALNDKGMLKQIQMMREGAYGTEAKTIIDNQDQIQIKQSLQYLNNFRNQLIKNKNISTQAQPGTKVAEDESVTTLTNLIKELESKQANLVSQKYKAIDFDGSFKAPVMKNFVKNIKNALEDSEFGIGAIPDSSFAPIANKSLSQLEKFTKPFLEKKKKLTKITLKELENERKRINNFISTAKDPTDRRALFVIKNQYDDFMQDTIEKGLANGDDGVLQAIKLARSEKRKYSEMFEPQNILKKGGKIKDRGGEFIQNVTRGEYTPEQIANWIYGNASTGKAYSSKSIDVLKKMESLFPKGSDGFEILKDGAFLRLVSSGFRKDGIKETFDPQLFIKSVNDSMNGSGRNISNIIYTNNEKKALIEFSKELQKTLTPEILKNPSRTASTLIDAIGSSTARSGLGVIAYNLGGIQTMLFTRFGFDNLAKASANNSARNMVMEALEINQLPNITGFAGAITTGVEQRPVIQQNRDLDKTEEILKLLRQN